jgi:hypothetical protein
MSLKVQVGKRPKSTKLKNWTDCSKWSAIEFAKNEFQSKWWVHMLSNGPAFLCQQSDKSRKRYFN